MADAILLKKAYVAAMRQMRKSAQWIGLLQYLDRHLDRPGAFYVRSLFAIYDFDDMLRIGRPWWTSEATLRISSFLARKNGQARVFEYGPGASTLWLAQRALCVRYVEHDVVFAQRLAERTKCLSHVSGQVRPGTTPQQGIEPACRSYRTGYTHLDFTDYVRAIETAGGPFDLIVIDGRARNACLGIAVAHLREGGIILFDNSERTRYQSALNVFHGTVTRLRGVCPGLPYLSESALLIPMMQ